MAVREIALDANALSTLLDPRVLDVEAVAAVLRRRNLRLVLVIDALTETCDAGLVHVARRLRNLAALATHLRDDRLTMAAQPATALALERRGVRLDSTRRLPRRAWEWFVQMGRDPIALAGQYTEVREAARRNLDKDAALHRDRMLEAESTVEFRRTSARALPEIPDVMRARYAVGATPLRDLVASSGDADSDAIVARLAAAPQRARAHAAFFAMMWINTLAIFVKHEQRAGLERAFTGARGDWVDASIVVAAAYCRGLVTRDGALREKIRVARDAGLLQIQTLTLAEVGLDPVGAPDRPTDARPRRPRRR